MLHTRGKYQRIYILSSSQSHLNILSEECGISEIKSDMHNLHEQVRESSSAIDAMLVIGKFSSCLRVVISAHIRGNDFNPPCSLSQSSHVESAYYTTSRDVRKG